MSNQIKSPTQKQGNQVNSLCIPTLPRVGHNIDWCINGQNVLPLGKWQIHHCGEGEHKTVDIKGANIYTGPLL